MNSFIAWVGGKKALRKLIYTMFPVQFDRYIEVFGGGGWVLFGKPPNLKRKLEVYNDYNSKVCCGRSFLFVEGWCYAQNYFYFPLSA